MSETESFIADVALKAIETTTRPELWPELCDLLAGQLNARTFMVFVHDLSGQSSPTTHVSALARSAAGRALVEGARRGEDVEDHEGYMRLAKAPFAKCLTEREVYGLPVTGRLPENRWREKVFAVTGARDRSAMRLNDIGPYLDCAIVHDSESHAVVPPPMARVEGFLAPLLARALEASRTMGALLHGYDALMTLFDSLDFGAAFCTPAGRVMVANAEFQRMARDRDAIATRNGHLTATSPEGAARMRRLLSAGPRTGGRPQDMTTTLPRRSGALPLVARAAMVKADQVGPAPLVMVLLIDPEDGDRISGQSLEAFDLLSGAELEVCDLLVRGFETRSIAERRDTSEETTRSQIKSATAKLHCRSRLDLLRLAMASRAPLRDRSAE